MTSIKLGKYEIDQLAYEYFKNVLGMSDDEIKIELKNQSNSLKE